MFNPFRYPKAGPWTSELNSRTSKEILAWPMPRIFKNGNITTLWKNYTNETPLSNEGMAIRTSYMQTTTKKQPARQLPGRPKYHDRCRGRPYLGTCQHVDKLHPARTERKCHLNCHPKSGCKQHNKDRHETTSSICVEARKCRHVAFNTTSYETLSCHR